MMHFLINELIKEFLENMDDEQWLQENEDRYYRALEIIISEFHSRPKVTVPILKIVNSVYPLRMLWINILRRWRIFGVHSIYIYQIKEMVCPKIREYPLKVISHDDKKSVVDAVLVAAVFKKYKKSGNKLNSKHSEALKK